jgi:hypothetical protein
MVNYEDGKIYKVQVKKADKKDKIFVGCTTFPYLSTCLAIQRNAFNAWLNDKGEYKPVFEIFLEEGVENCQIVLVESFPCDSKAHLNKRRIFWEQKLC